LSDVMNVENTFSIAKCYLMLC